MVLQRSAALLAIAPLSVLAQWDTASNLTIKLFPSDEEEKCQEGDSGGLSITTETLPRYRTCLDLEKLFSGDKYNGFTNDTTSHSVIYDEGVEEHLRPPGVAWHILGGLGDFDPETNWTNIWFEQRNQSADGEPEDGEDGRWVVDTYANNECIRSNTTEFPWYETSCQTGEDGQCETTPYSIKSIAIRPFLHYEFGDCQTWAEVGAAPGLVPKVSAVLLGIGAYLLLL